MTDLEPTLKPERSFLDWPVATEAAGWNARVALLGVRHSEPYGHDPFPNDQAKAPGAIRAMSHSFCYDAAHWDFDVGADLASSLPSHVDMGDVELEIPDCFIDEVSEQFIEKQPREARKKPWQTRASTVNVTAISS